MKATSPSLIRPLSFLNKAVLSTSMLVAASMLPTFSYAQVKIIESASTEQVRKQQQASANDAAWANAAKQLFVDLQGLRDEVIRLNGMVEEQQYEIDRLKQQQLDNYVDLDKRVAALSQGGVAPAAAEAADAEGGVATPDIDDKTAYKAAYALVQERQFDEAKLAFQAFIKAYPNSSLIANAWFWLGGLHDLSKTYVEAEQAYNTVLNDYPQHRKAPDAMYKLGDIYYKQDKKDMAKAQMQKLIATYDGNASYDKVVRMARDFLRKHFP